MNALQKQLITIGFLLIPVLTLAQESRFLEFTVSDTVTVKPTGYLYKINLGQQMEFMGIRIPQGNTTDDQDIPSIDVVTNRIKSGNFKYTLSLEKDYSISASPSQPGILVHVATEKELSSLLDLLKDQQGISGKVKEVEYESLSRYQSEIFKNLYAKALAQAGIMATITGNSLGRLISVSEVKESKENYMDSYKELLKGFPTGLFIEQNVSAKKEVINYSFRFELK
jgi:hypothetical protein